MPSSRQTAACAALLLWPRLLCAWSVNGHRTAARIAQDRLSPAASRAVADILGPEVTLERISACADAIRGRGAKPGEAPRPEPRSVSCGGLVFKSQPKSGPWHYIDIPVSDSPAGAPDLERYCKAAGCVVSRLRAEAETLKDPGASRTDKQGALMFLVHFMGDVHQPMHCVTEIVDGVNDAGGNRKPVTFPGAPEAATDEPEHWDRAMTAGLNLHSLWDHIVAVKDDSDPAALSSQLEEDIKGKDTRPWVSGDFITQAALEGFHAAKTRIYPAYHAPNGGRIDSSYVNAMRPVAHESLEKAGVRLAALLEQALAGEAAPASRTVW